MRIIDSDIPGCMTLSEYRKLVNRPKRQSAIRRLANFCRAGRFSTGPASSSS
jgi:hypothetical protein